MIDLIHKIIFSIAVPVGAVLGSVFYPFYIAGVFIKSFFVTAKTFKK